MGNRMPQATRPSIWGNPSSLSGVHPFDFRRERGPHSWSCHSSESSTQLVLHGTATDQQHVGDGVVRIVGCVVVSPDLSWLLLASLYETMSI